MSEHKARLLLYAAFMLPGCGGGDADDTGAGGTVVVAPAPTPTPSATPTPSPTPSATPSAQPTAVSFWRPAVGDSWQLQLQGDVNTSYDVKVYDIDLFDTPQAKIDALHARNIRVVCYFSAGSSEEFRADYPAFLNSDKGARLDDWPGERWLDVRSANVRLIMQRRMDLAVTKKCDGVDPDNVDGYSNANGLGLTAIDQLDYNRWLATEAHRRGLAVGLKNDVDQIGALVDSFDFQVNEQCHEFNECSLVEPFPRAGKPVFNVEYQDRYRTDASARVALCTATRRAQLRTLILPLELDDRFRLSCD